VHGRRLAGTRNDAEDLVSGQQRGNGHRDRVRRHIGQPEKAAVIDLLLARSLVERHHLDELGIGEVGDAGIVEGDMAVLPDTRAHDVDGPRREHAGVPLRLQRRVPAGPDQLDPAGANPIEEPVPQVVAETLGCRLVQAHVLVHVQGGHPRPVDAGRSREAVQHRVLRRRGREDHPDGLLAA